MKKIAWLLGMAALLSGGIGCGGTCGDFCDYSLACLEEDTGCDLDDPDAIHDDCYDECGKAMDRLSGDENDELSACVACVAEELGSPDECNDGDYSDAIQDCDDECEEDGVGEFFEEFDLNLDSGDLDC